MKINLSIEQADNGIIVRKVSDDEVGVDVVEAPRSEFENEREKYYAYLGRLLWDEIEAVMDGDVTNRIAVDVDVRDEKEIIKN